MREAGQHALRVCLGVFVVAASGPGGAVEFSYSGYLREHWSVNLQNNETFEPKGFDPGAPGVAFRAPGETVGGQWEPSMIRHSGKLEGLLTAGPLTFGAVGRANYETRTSYERGLQDISKQMPAITTLEAAGALFPLVSDVLPQVPGTQIMANASAFTSAFMNAFLDGLAPPCAGLPPFPGGPDCYAAGLPGIRGGTQRSLFLEDYDGTEMREWWVMFDTGARTHFKLGKQQVVWGETDFFRAMDIIHGYDLRWRSFLELENEELRKPLIMANVQLDVPELGGSLQFILRPGWDDGEDIGDNAPIRGGRWAPAPWSGADIPGSLLAPYNYHHDKGDEDDASYGVRWGGTFKQIGYSLNYYRGQNTDLVAVRSPLLGSTYGNWEGPTFAVNELIFPRTSTFGITLNAYSGLLDSVLRGEAAFTPDKPYNTGTQTYIDLFRFLGAANAAAGGLAGDFTSAPPPGGFGPGHVVLNDPSRPGSAYTPGTPVTADGSVVVATLAVPGHGPVVEKDTLRLMVGLDKNLRWTMRSLNTSRPATWTAQVFDTWVLNHDEDDDIVENIGFSAARREHQTFLTNAVSLPFDYDTVTFTLAAGVDLGSFDAFVIPSVDLVFGDHWRVRLEADIFLPRHVKSFNLGVPEMGDGRTRTLGTLNDRDQLVARITYQF
jgi:hypothetical protein